jgi:hypothetical protein
MATAIRIETGKGMNGKGMEPCLPGLYSIAVHSLACASGDISGSCAWRIAGKNRNSAKVESLEMKQPSR